MDEFTHFLAFSLDGRTFGLPLSAVERVVRAVQVTPLPDAPPMVLGVINVEGRIVTVVNLRRRCGLNERDISPDDQFIIAHTPDRSVALPVDSAEVAVCGRESIVPAAGALPGIHGVREVVKRESGLILIYDVDALLSPDEDGAAGGGPAATAKGGGRYLAAETHAVESGLTLEGAERSAERRGAAPPRAPAAAETQHATDAATTFGGDGP